MRIFSTDIAAYQEIVGSFEFSGPYLSAYIIIAAVLVFFSFVMYIVQGIAFYLVAKDRKMNAPYISFIPFLNAFQIGSIADHINYKNNKKSSYGPALLILNLLCVVFTIVFAALYKLGYSLQMPKVIISGTVLLFIALALAIAYTVVLYVVYYIMYKDYLPENAVLFLIFSIFFAPLAPFCVLLLKNGKSRSMKNEKARD